MSDAPSDGVNAVKPKRCRQGMKQCQGTPPKVRMDRLKVKLEDLTHHTEVLQKNYNMQTEEMAKEAAIRASLVTLLKTSETTSQNRLNVIKKEVPNYSRALLSGALDRYKANLL